MAAHLYPGIKSLHLVLDTPYDLIRTDDIRDDIIGVKVWYSTTSGFNPASGQGTLAFDGLSLSITIPNLETNTRYYVRYAFISAIDPTTYTISAELTEQVYDENVKVYGYLTNDPTAIATEADGTGGNFSLATGTFKVYSLSQDVTGNGPVYSIKANSTYHILGATINPATGVYSCTGMDANSGSITFLATYNNITVEQVWNVYKGIAGANAPLVKITATNSDFIFKDQFATVPETAETKLTAVLTNITGTAVFTTEGFTREGTSLGSVSFTQNGNTITITGTQVGDKGVTLGSINVTATVGTVSDTFTLYRINDGTEQITVELSNSAHVIPAANNGDTVSANYVGSGTIIKVKQGNTYLNVDPSTPYDTLGTWNIFNITSSNITCDPTPTIGGNYINFDTHAAMTADQAYIDYTILYRTTTGHEGSQTVRQSFAKSKEGVLGSSAASVTITASRLAFVKPKNTTTVSPNSIVLTATTSNINNAQYSWQVDGVTQTGQTSNTFTISSFSNVTSKTIRVDASGTNDKGLAISTFDTFTIYYIAEGDDSIAVGLDNENQTIACDSTGTPISGQFPITINSIVVRGTDILTSGITYAKTDEFGMTSSISSAGVITVTNISQLTARATYSFTVGNVTVYKTVNLNKSIDGASAPVVNLTTPNQVFITLKNNGGYNLNSVTITATSINISSPSYAWYVDGALQSGQTNSTFTVNAFASGSSKVVKCIVSGGSVTAYDELTIFSIQEGSDSYMAGLTNENQTLTADKDGVLYSGQLPLTSQMVVVRGATVLSSGVTYSKVSETGMTSTINSSTGVISVSAFSATAQATATYRATIGTVVLDKVLTINKTKDGATGSPGSPGAKGDPGDPGGQGYRGISSRIIYYKATQGSTPPGTPSTTGSDYSGTTMPPESGWQATAPTVSVGEIIFYSYGKYNGNYTTIDGIAAYTTVWSTPIAASIFQDIRSDNWAYVTTSNTVSSGVPSLTAFSNMYQDSTSAVQSGYYIQRDTGNFWGTNVYMQGQIVAKGQTSSVTVNWTNDPGQAGQTTYTARSGLLGYALGGVDAGESNILRVGLTGFTPDASSYSAWNVGVFAISRGSTSGGVGNKKGIGLIANGDAVGAYISCPLATSIGLVVKSYAGTNQAANFEGNVTITRGLIVQNGISVTGDITATGNVTAYSSSDKRLKTNILKILQPLDKLNSISGYTYDWLPEYLNKYSKEVALGLVKPHDSGVIAQEVLEIMPEAIHTRSDGTLAVNYEKLIPLLIEAVKELDRRTR